MLVNFVFILFILKVRSYEIINDIEEIHDDQSDKSLEYNNESTVPNITPRLFLLPYKPFHKPQKGKNTSLPNFPEEHITSTTLDQNENFTILTTTDKPLLLKPKPLKPAVDKPIIHKPVIHKPAIQKPTINKPGNQKPAINKPVIQKPSINKPVIHKPVIHKPAIHKPASAKPTSQPNTMTSPLTTPSDITSPNNADVIPVLNSVENTTLLPDGCETLNLTIADETTTTVISEDESTTEIISTTNKTNVATEYKTNDTVTTASTLNNSEHSNVYNDESEICIHANEYQTIPEECDTYIECKRYVATRMECPEGLLFNSKTAWPDYPCSYPSEVKCEGIITQESNPTSECEHQYGFFPSPNQNCSQYIMCQEGKALTMSCPTGLVFSTKSSSCDWPENVPNCTPTAFENFKCPEDSSENELGFKYRYGDSCRDYVLCLQGHPRLLKCDLGFAFEEEQGFCVNSDYISDCI